MTIEITNTEDINAILEFYFPDDKVEYINPRTHEINYIVSNKLQDKLDIVNIGLYKPEVILVWGADLAYSQLEIWSHILRRSKIRHAIFTKSLKNKKQDYAKLDNVPIFGEAEGSNLKIIANASPNVSTMMFMTDKNQNFGYLRAYPNLIHVAAHHGDSEKHSSSSRHFAAYDFMLVSDKHAMNRYIAENIRFTPDNFITIGNSVIEGVKFEPGIKTKINNIIYAPTFEGHSEGVNFSSLQRVTTEIKAIFPSKNVVVRPHPGTGLRIKVNKSIVKDLIKSNPFKFTKDKMDQFNWSDILVCDISGILSEYLFTGKPIIVPVSDKDDWLYEYIKNLHLDYIYFWDKNRISLLELISKIEKNDKLSRNRLHRRNELFNGIETLQDSVDVYDRAMHYFNEVKFWRDLRLGKHRLNISKRFDTVPKEAHLVEIISKIRLGKAMLVAPN